MDQPPFDRDLLFQELADSSASLIYAVDLEGRFIFANRRLAELFGVEPSELVGKTRQDFMPPAVCEEHRANDRLVIESNQPLTFEESNEEADGVHYYLSVKTPLVDSEGRVFAVGGTSTDITERKRAEDQLALSEQRYRQLFEHAPIGYQSLDAEARFITVNEAWSAMLGYSMDEVVGRWFGELMVPESAAAVQERFPQFKARGQVSTVFEMIAKDGEHKWIAFEGRIGYEPDGSFKQTHCVLRDTTQEKKAAEALRESEAKFSTAFYTSPDSVNINRLSDGLYLEINKGFTELTGYTEDDVAGKSSLEIAIWADPADRERLVAGLRADGVVNNLEAQFRRKDGTLTTALMSATVIELGGEACILSVTRDISEIKAAERARKTILRTAMDGFWLTDATGKILEVNEAYCAMSGYSAAELERMSISDLDVDEEPTDTAVRADQIAARGAHRFETRHRRKDGTVFDVESSVRYQPETGVFSAFLRDITDRRQSEEQLAQAYASIIEVVGRVVETRDPYTAGHQKRVAQLAVAIASEMGMPDDELDEIRDASLVHDIGKISIPAEILGKPGRLLPIEFNLIKGHAQAGYEILHSARMPGRVPEIVHQHHERCDGSGYPRGLCAEDLLLQAKVIMVADVVEAMMSHRPYRAALGTEAALAEIERGYGAEYAPDVAEACLRLFRTERFEFSG